MQECEGVCVCCAQREKEMGEREDGGLRNCFRIFFININEVFIEDFINIISVSEIILLKTFGIIIKTVWNTFLL